ncbi:MAG: hypothetical protein PGN13_14605 [Patulibacter minatonensis]
MTVDEGLAAENARLRARVEQLEVEVSALRADTAATVASAQETLYWFERWGLDFNRIMGTSQAELARKSFRGVRLGYRWSKTRYFVLRTFARRLTRRA